MISEAMAVTLLVTEALENLGVTYLVGGSFASTVHGEVRTTLDSDLLADLHTDDVAPLARALGSNFYIDEGMIHEAIAFRSSFNVIHMATMFKVDVFIPKRRAFDREQLRRRVQHVVATDPDRMAYFATAEDIVLAKLDWYRQGGGISERQWRDVVGIVRVQGARLDLAYLRRWAAELGVADILERALSEGGAMRNGSGGLPG